MTLCLLQIRLPLEDDLEDERWLVGPSAGQTSGGHSLHTSDWQVKNPCLG
jgi:hypothetical protein